MGSTTGSTRDFAGLRGRLKERTLPTPTDVGSELRELVLPRLDHDTGQAPELGPRRSMGFNPASSPPIPRPERVRRRSSRRRRGWRQRLPLALMACATVCLVVAFAQVRLNRQATTGTVVLAIDVSRSMNATDISPDRLAAAVSAAHAFLQRLPQGLEVGLVTFGAESTVAVPPVSSRTTLLDALDALATQSQPGTVIGDGLSAAIDSILASRGDDSDRPAAIVLLTDGQDIGRTIAPTDAAARAKRLAIPVFTVAMVGSGLNAGPTEPAGTASSDLLQQIAETTGAKVFTAGSANELTQVYATLASQMSYELAIGNGAGPFVIVAVLLTFVSAALVLLGSRDPYSEPTSRSRLHRH